MEKLFIEVSNADFDELEALARSNPHCSKKGFEAAEWLAKRIIKSWISDKK